MFEILCCRLKLSEFSVIRSSLSSTLSDAIIHEKTGIICDGNNLEEIYSSIDKLLKDHRYKEYGKAAKEFSEKFNWKKIIKSYQKIL